MKRRVSIFLLIGMLLSLFSSAAFRMKAFADTETKQYGELTYTASDGEITITQCSNDAEGTVEIPNTIDGLPVTAITSPGFKECRKITAISIPENCIKLKDYTCFDYCSSLERISVDPNNTAFCSDEGILYDKEKIKLIKAPDMSTGSSFTVPNGVTDIVDFAFASNPNLESVTLPDVVRIGNSSFSTCRNLKTVILSEKLKKMYGCAFDSCSSLEEIALPDSLEFLVASFYYCTKLRTITIPKQCEVRGNPFIGCTSLESVSVDPDNPYCCSDKGILYNKDKSTLMAVPNMGVGTSFTVPSGVTTIGQDAFADNTELEKVILNDVTTIESSGFSQLKNLHTIEFGDELQKIERSAFSNCRKLTTVSIPAKCSVLSGDVFEYCVSLESISVDPKNPTFCSEGGIVYSKDMKTILIVPNKSTGTVFRVPSGVETIGDCSFYTCKRVEDVVIPESTETIGNCAFGWCKGLNNVYFSGDCPDINTRSFNGTTITAHYPEGNETWTEDKLQNYGGTVVWKTWNPKNDLGITNYSYSFSNSSAAFGYPDDYTIPLSSYQLIYGNNVRAEDMYLRKTYIDIPNKIKRTWDGSCAGMTATSEMLADSTNGINPVNFNAGASVPRDLKVKDTFAELEIDLTAFIEAMHIAQYTQLFKDDRASTRVVTSDINAGRNNLNDFHNQIKAETDAGRPVLLAMMPGTGQGHAVLGYAVEDHEDGTSEIKIYDNRWPLQDLSMTLEKDSAGNYTSWAYDMDANGKEAYGVWGTELSGSNISFVYYDTIMEIWNTRGNLAENGSTNMLTINSDDFSLYSSNGKELARVENGELVKTSNDIDLMERELSLREEYEPDNVIVAPIAVYRVVNNDESIDTLEVSAANEDLGASISTTADEVVVAVQDSINYNSVTVCAEPEDTYSVSLKSTLNDDYNEIIAEGKGTEEEASISMINGVLDVEDCSLSSLVVDGEDKGPFTIKASAQTGGKISPSGETQSVKGENETYTITPNAGYVISDVLVDGKSIGAIAKYEFKNIDKDHTIEAKFKKTNLYGDATGDGQVDAKDLTSLARHLAKIEIIKDTDLFENSDVNHDGKVTAEDLTKLARFIAKIISSLD